MTIDGLVNEIGPLSQTYPLFKPDTILTSSELTTERRTDKYLREICFYTANVSLYIVENGKAVLYFGQRDAFNIVIGSNIGEATRQLTTNGCYMPSPRDFQDTIGLESTLKVNIFDLELKDIKFGIMEELGYFRIDPKNYDKLNQAQRKLAEAVYGTGNDFVKNMNMLSERIKIIDIYVLKRGYVIKLIKDSPIAMAGWLGNFNNNSAFNASGHRVTDIFALRGELMREKV